MATIKISPIPNDNTADISLVEFDVAGYPSCTHHGAMNKVSQFEENSLIGYWRCNVTSKTECKAGCIGQQIK